MPPFCSAWRISRVSVLVPMPHVTLHPDLTGTEACTQSTGQGFSASPLSSRQFRFEVSVGHTTPPCRAICVMLRVRYCWALSGSPHVLGHTDQEPQFVVSQCTGQAPSSQDLSSCRSPHVRPPFSGVRTT